MQQQILPLEFSTYNYDKEDYIVTKNNQELYQYITNFPNWPHKIILIYGQKMSGKTHISHVFQQVSSAIFLQAEDLNIDYLESLKNKCLILENIENITNEKGLFHLYNIALQNDLFLLLTSSIPQGKLHFQTLDIQSRIRSIISFSLPERDEQILQFIILKYFHDCNINVSIEIVNYIIQKSYGIRTENITDILEKIKYSILQNKGKVTKSLIDRQIM